METYKKSNVTVYMGNISLRPNLNSNSLFFTGITLHQIDTLETGMKLALIGKSYMLKAIVNKSTMLIREGQIYAIWSIKAFFQLFIW